MMSLFDANQEQAMLMHHVKSAEIVHQVMIFHQCSVWTKAFILMETSTATNVAKETCSLYVSPTYLIAQ